MSRQIFQVFFLLFFVCCQLCGQKCAAQSGQVKSSTEEKPPVEFFTKEEVESTIKLNDTKSETITAMKVESVFLFAADGLMTALAEVKNEEQSKGKNETVLAKYIETTEEKWGDEAVKNDTTNNNKWKAQFVVKDQKQPENNDGTKSFAVVVEKDKIYYIKISKNTLKTEGSTGSSPVKDWHIRVVEGTVKNTTDNKKEIMWANSSIFEFNKNDKIIEKLETTPKVLPPSDGFAFLANNKKSIIFVMNGRAKEGSNEKNIVAVFQLDIEGNNKRMELLQVDGTINCFPSFFTWVGNAHMRSTFCSQNDNQFLKVFDEKEKQFKEKDEPIAHLLQFLSNKKYFSTAFIESKNVLFFIQEKTMNNKKNVYFWMTDGTRVSYVGTIFNDIKSILYASIVHTNDELFALIYITQTTAGSDQEAHKNKVLFIRLTKYLKNIADNLRAWEETNEVVMSLCKNTDNEDIFCTPPLPTPGLVGFLHNNIIENSKKWKDEYLYVNAILKNEKKEKNGIKFAGAGAGAVWPVAKGEEEQPYNFTDPGFTLVATVTINGDAKDNELNSVLGVVFHEANNNQSTKSVGLWCNTENNWVVNVEKKDILKESKDKCEKGKTYNVAFVLGKKINLNIYIDRINLNFVDDKKINIATSQNITHFYFGADGSAQPAVKTDVTVANVLLYNRPLTTDEIELLKEQQIKKGILEKNTRKDKAEIKLLMSFWHILSVLIFLFNMFTLMEHYV